MKKYFNNQVLWIFAFSLILSWMAFRNIHPHPVIDRSYTLTPGVRDSDSLQILTDSYESLQRGLEVMEKIKIQQNRLLAENNNEIKNQNEKQTEWKLAKSRIYGKSVHKAKIKLTGDDSIALVKYDTLIAVSERKIAELKTKNENLQTNLVRTSQNMNRRRFQIETVLLKIENYASSINGARTLRFGEVKYQIYVANLNSEEIRLHLYVPGTKNRNFLGFKEVKDYLDNDKRPPLMITNAGMFTPSYQPQGLYLEKETATFFPIDTIGVNPGLNFYLKPNGVFYIDEFNIPHIDSTEILQRWNPEELKKLVLATQSGPMLVINGAIHKAFRPDSKNLKIRNGVGLIRDNDKKVVFAITINEVNFYDFASFFHEIFGCDNALFLDGTVSQMFIQGVTGKPTEGKFGPIISVSRKKE